MRIMLVIVAEFSVSPRRCIIPRPVARICALVIAITEKKTAPTSSNCRQFRARDNKHEPKLSQSTPNNTNAARDLRLSEIRPMLTVETMFPIATTVKYVAVAVSDAPK